jgi:hypothetical protein
MKTYRVYFEEAFDVLIEADNTEKARTKLFAGDYEGTPNHREITCVEVVELQDGKELE